MATGKIPGARQASVKEVRELSKLPWVRDDALSDRSTEARLLPDGRVLLYWGEGMQGNIYPSRAAVEQLQRECAEMMAKGSVDLTRTLLPPVAEFLRDVDAHAKSLGKRIGVPDEALDGTEPSLGAVDAALKRVRLAKRMTPEIVTPLVAYVGQVMLPVCGGRWTSAYPRRDMQLTRYPDGTTKMGPVTTMVTDGNEPMITARDGRILQPFALVVIPMVEPSKRLPLRAAVDVTLISYRDRPGGAGGAAPAAGGQT